jgi:hypothetical protein
VRGSSGAFVRRERAVRVDVALEAAEELGAGRGRAVYGVMLRPPAMDREAGTEGSL